MNLGKLLMAGCVAALAMLSCGDCDAQGAESRPNILLILSDDHSAPFLGCYGNSTIKSPNLDKFASEGVRFTKMFTGAPQCVPSRATMLTGRSPVAARISRFNSPLPRDVVSLPELLREKAGYFTGVCRRNFHLDGPAGARVGPITDAVYREHHLRTFEDRVDFLDRNSPRGQTVAKVNEFFDKAPADKPWFLWVNFNDPHHPWDVNAIAPPYSPEQIKVPAWLPDLPGVRSDLARYCNEIARMDEEFQMVLDTVASRNRGENTLVIFAGDNGMAFPHGKGSLYDPGLNVPLLVRWTGPVKAGVVSDELISGEDITPTCLDAAGVPRPKEMTGRSFLKLLRGEPHESRAYIFAERGVHGSATFNQKTKANGYDLSRCVRSATHKLIYNCTPWMEYVPVDSGGDPGWKQMVAAHASGNLPPELDRAYFTNPRPIYELYDLTADPAELNNLAGRGDVAQIERKLRHALIEKMIIDFDYLPLPPE